MDPEEQEQISREKQKGAMARNMKSQEQKSFTCNNKNMGVYYATAIRLSRNMNKLRHISYAYTFNYILGI